MMFSAKYGDLKKIEASLDMDYSMVRPVSDRAYWESLKPAMEGPLKDYLESVKDFNYMLPASLFMEYSRNGNRVNYETVQFARCRTLVAYALMEALANDGSYMDAVVDFVWLLLEQTTWCFPAHKHLTASSDALCAADEPTLDLFQAETGCTLAFVYALLKDKLDAVSKNITPRMHKEINFRVIDNFMNRSDYWWQGFSPDIFGVKVIVNNWNPWIISNVLFAATAVTASPRRLAEVVQKAMACLDNYTDVYPADGACDEGPSYWNRAGLSLLDCTMLLCDVTKGYIDETKHPKIFNTAEYITKIQIGNSYVVNFADCNAKLASKSYGTHIKYARRIGSAALEALALDAIQKDTEPDFSSVWHVPRVMDYFEARTFDANKAVSPTYHLHTYFDSIQVAVAREAEDLSGLFLAAKGGHNKESHNHNDVGHFIVYKNQTPFIIDPGHETYCAKTFSPQRYELWANQSAFHNVPVIAGAEQQNGREFAAQNVTFEAQGEQVTFSLDIGGAYENRSDIKRWNRSFLFSRGDKSVTVTDEFSLFAPAVSSWTLMTVCDIEIKDGAISLIAENGEALTVEADLSLFDITWEPVETADDLIMKAWGKAPVRITLTLKQAMQQGTVTLRMR